MLAEAQRRAGDPTLARATAEQAMAAAAEVAGDCTRLRAAAHVAFGNLAADAGDLGAARREHDAAHEILEARVGRDHPALLSALNAQARLYARSGDPVAARAGAERALVLAAAAGLDRHLEMATALETLAATALAAGRRGEADERLMQSQAIVIHRLGALSPRARRLAVERQRVADA